MVMITLDDNFLMVTVRRTMNMYMIIGALHNYLIVSVSAVKVDMIIVARDSHSVPGKRSNIWSNNTRNMYHVGATDESRCRQSAMNVDMVVIALDNDFVVMIMSAAPYGTIAVAHARCSSDPNVRA